MEDVMDDYKISDIVQDLGMIYNMIDELSCQLSELNEKTDVILYKVCYRWT